MGSDNILQNILIDANESVLVLIDIQDLFLNKLVRESAHLIVNHAGWLIEIAKILSIPIIVTAEDIAHCGSITTSLAEKLPPNTPVYNKMIFNFADNPEIIEAVEKTDRKTTILAGLETDVCIAQSAIGLMQSGYQVVTVADACASPGEAHLVGLERMRGAGVLITSCKSLYYEWVRGVEKSEEISQRHFPEIGTPKDVIL
jgi:nicotinamidase-related amidase